MEAYLLVVPEDLGGADVDDAGVSMKPAHDSPDKPWTLFSVSVVSQEGASVTPPDDQGTKDQVSVSAGLETGVQDPAYLLTFGAKDLHACEVTEALCLGVAAQDAVAGHGQV